MQFLFEARYFGFASQLTASRKNFRELVFASFDIFVRLRSTRPFAFRFVWFGFHVEFGVFGGFWDGAVASCVPVAADPSAQCRGLMTARFRSSPDWRDPPGTQSPCAKKWMGAAWLDFLSHGAYYRRESVSPGPLQRAGK